MLSKLVGAYEETSKGKKTLIFNNGIHTSIQVYHAFKKAGYPIAHLDNTNTKKERDFIRVTLLFICLKFKLWGLNSIFLLFQLLFLGYANQKNIYRTGSHQKTGVLLCVSGTLPSRNCAETYRYVYDT